MKSNTQTGDLNFVTYRWIECEKNVTTYLTKPENNVTVTVEE